ncbi:MAG: hypothetical protein AAB535_03500 [Patescibacteria group bacterium]
MNKRYLLPLTIAWGLLASAALYLWVNNQKLEVRNKTLTDSNEIHRRLIENEVESYRTIYDCFVVNRGQCNPDDFKDKLQTLGDEASEFYKQIEIFDQRLQLLRK